MIRNIIILFLLDFIFTIGIDGLKIPTNIMSLNKGKTSQLGLENYSKLLDEDSFVEYNSLNWVTGINGKSINWKNANGFLKYVSINTIVDNEVYYYGDTPNDNSDFKLPASLYSASMVLSKILFDINSALEIKSFLSRLYHQKDYGLILNVFLEKKINSFNSISFSINNFCFLFGEDKEIFSPDGLNFLYSTGFRNSPYELGIGVNSDKAEYSSFGYVRFMKSIFTSNLSIDYNLNRGFGYTGSLLIDYNNFTIGYSISTPILKSLSSPQIISIKFNF